MDSGMTASTNPMQPASLFESAPSAAAEARLRRLLLSFGVAGPEADRLVATLLAGALEVWREHRSFDLAALAEEEAAHRLAVWSGQVLDLAELPAASLLLIGRAAFLACGGAERWADLLLAEPAQLPAEFVTAMREAAPAVVPPEAPETMVDQPYDTWSLRGLLSAPSARPRTSGGRSSFLATAWRDPRALLSVAWRGLNSVP
jgi:hypothetical protein